jgi:hypothetical protein
MLNNQHLFKQPTKPLARIGNRELKKLTSVICRGGKYNATTRIFTHIARGTNARNYATTDFMFRATNASNPPAKIASLNKKLKRQYLQIERLAPVKGWSARQHAWVLVKDKEVQA